MANATRAISVNGWKNVLALLQTSIAGYNGGLVKMITIINNNATAATVHLNDSAAQPSTASDGLPIGSTAATAPSPAVTLENIDLAQLWVNTAGAQTLVFLVNGR
jgi:hypothetical protein